MGVFPRQEDVGGNDRSPNQTFGKQAEREFLLYYANLGPLLKGRQ